MAGSSPLFSALLFLVYLSVNLGALVLGTVSQQQDTKFINSTAVAIAELMKFAVSLISIYGSERSIRSLLSIVIQTLFEQPSELLKVSVPALLYTIQNNVIYAAMGHLDAVSFQITYQIKIVMALLASRVLLKTKVSRLKWLSVIILTLGVVLVQVPALPRRCCHALRHFQLCSVPLLPVVALTS